MKLISKDALVAEMKRRISNLEQLGDRKFIEIHFPEQLRFIKVYEGIINFSNTIEVKEVDLEKESELIANGIMISVQSNKYGTNTYNTERNDFNHYHLKMAARKGIELRLKAQNYNNKCEDLRDDGICNFATTKLGRTMRCENISCSRRNKAQEGE